MSNPRPTSTKAEHHRLYWKRSWRDRIRVHQLRTHPWCVLCEQRGIAVAATVADHVTPHHGDPIAFRTGKLQSLCKACHDSAKRLQEMRGTTPGCNELGEPLDPNHAWYADETSDNTTTTHTNIRTPYHTTTSVSQRNKTGTKFSAAPNARISRLTKR